MIIFVTNRYKLVFEYILMNNKMLINKRIQKFLYFIQPKYFYQDKAFPKGLNFENKSHYLKKIFQLVCY